MGGFVHLELNTDNVKKAKSFYTKLFGWETNDMEMPGGGPPYTMLSLQNPGGAISKSAMEAAPSMWVPYIAVDDVKKTVAAAEKNGGTAAMPYFNVEGMGEGAVLIDPTGAAFGIWCTTGGNGAQAASTSKKASKKKAASKKTAAKKSSSKKAAPKKAAKKKGKKK